MKKTLEGGIKVKKKVTSFFSIIVIVCILTISVVSASKYIITQSMDDDSTDAGSITPITIDEYVCFTGIEIREVI